LIINLKEENYHEILEVWEASVRSNHTFLEEEDILFFKKAMPKFFSSVILKGIRDEKGKLLGFSGINEEESSLKMIFVEPKSFRKGFGKELILDAINNHKIKKITTNEENEVAFKFFKDFGFEVISRSEKDGIGKDHTVLHMELKK